MAVNGNPACYWCNEEVESYDLRMGEVRIVRRGRSRPTFDFSRVREWEEEIEERRPFHRQCWEAYKRHR